MWFTDRPARDSDSMSFEYLAGLWDVKGSNSFASDPPNIAIVTQDGESRGTIIADMRNPRVATTTDGAKYFTARVRTETKKGTTQIAKSDSALARHAKTPPTHPSPTTSDPPASSLTRKTWAKACPTAWTP